MCLKNFRLVEGGSLTPLNILNFGNLVPYVCSTQEGASIDPINDVEAIAIFIPLVVILMSPGRHFVKWLPQPSEAKSVVAKYPNRFIICLSTSVPNLVLLSQNAH